MEADGGAGENFATEPQLPTTYSNKIKFTSSTHIGARGNQEDRFVACPDLLGGEYAWFGVYDGTVKEHARFVMYLFLSNPDVTPT